MTRNGKFSVESTTKATDEGHIKYVEGEGEMEKTVDESSSASSTSQDSVDSMKKDKKKKKEKKEKDPDAQPPVPWMQLFRFASTSDQVLMFVGSLAALGTGLSMPAMLILFGDITNSLVSGGLDNDILNDIRCNASFYFPNNTL